MCINMFTDVVMQPFEMNVSGFQKIGAVISFIFDANLYSCQN